MGVSVLLGELRDEMASLDDPLRNVNALEIWCARVRAVVVGSYPEKLAELDHLVTPLASAALPRLAPRLSVGVGPTKSARQTLIGGEGVKARLLAFLETLSLAGEAPGAPQSERRPSESSRPLPGKPTPWVFISSVRQEAEMYRNSARAACLRKKMLPIGMESWSAAARPPADVCRDYIRQCDVLVLILLHRYGSIEPVSGKSYTELECEEARAAGKDILAFEITSVPAGIPPMMMDSEDLRRLQRFSAGLQLQLRGRAETPDQLELAVLQALDEWHLSFSR